jgi:hypothetical protein
LLNCHRYTERTLCEQIGLIIMVITGGRVINLIQLVGLGARNVHDAQKAIAFSVPLRNNLFKERIETTLVKSVGYILRARLKQG